MKYYNLNLNNTTIDFILSDDENKYDVFSSNIKSIEDLRKDLSNIVAKEIDNYRKDKFSFYYIWYSFIVFTFSYIVLSIIPDPFILWDEMIISLVISYIFYSYKRKNIDKTKGFIKLVFNYTKAFEKIVYYKHNMIEKLEVFVSNNFTQDVVKAKNSKILLDKEFSNFLLENLKEKYYYQYKLSLKILKKKDAIIYQKKYLDNNTIIIFLFLTLINSQENDLKLIKQ